ncbi:hypothetical protein [Pseudomonas boanensis]|uniref:hypothetical protein n=1 Tax=Metapseudomonas boanensis TaxID=2822138 RepID=UPI0035D3DA00
MCRAVEISGLYTSAGSRQRVSYPDLDAALPIHDPTRGVVWIPWGRRSEERGQLPATGWVVEGSQMEEAWSAYAPTPVLSPVVRFMELTRDGEARWFVVEDGKALQCLLLHHGDERRVYVVTTEPPAARTLEYGSWPLTRVPDPPAPVQVAR